MSGMCHLPSLFLFLLLVASMSTTIVLMLSHIQNLRAETQQNIDQVNSNLNSIESKQKYFEQQIQTLTKLVVQSLNATDEYMEYINNVTDTVTEAKEVFHQDVEQVNQLANSQNSLSAVQFAGMFTLLVILVSGYHMSQHLRHFDSPVVQRKILAVLWMTPIYAITSWMSLLFPLAEPYLAVIREFYESYCVYTFLSFLISVLGRGNRVAVVDLLESRAMELSPPDRCGCPKLQCCHASKKNKSNQTDGTKNVTFLQHAMMNTSSSSHNYNDADRDSHTVTTLEDSISVAEKLQLERERFPSIDPTSARQKAEAVLDQCQTYAMQFVLLRPLTAIGWLVSNQLVEPKSFLDWTCPQIYIVIVTNISIFLAFRGLVKFYHATRRYLAWCNPWPKFLCIKGVVFMTFWQKMTLSIIIHLAYIDRFSSNDEATNFVARVQNFLICLEMLFAAVAHCFVFPPEEWAEGYREREEIRRKRLSEFETHFGDSVALLDFIRDVRTVMRSSRERRQRKRSRNGAEALPPHSPDNNHHMDEDEADEDIIGDTTVRNISIELPHSSFLFPEPTRTCVDSIESVGNDVVEVDSTSLSSQIAPTIKHNELSYCTPSESDVEFRGSWARIEKYINEHRPSRNLDSTHPSSSGDAAFSSKEVV